MPTLQAQWHTQKHRMTKWVGPSAHNHTHTPICTHAHTLPYAQHVVSSPTPKHNIKIDNVIVGRAWYLVWLTCKKSTLMVNAWCVQYSPPPPLALPHVGVWTHTHTLHIKNCMRCWPSLHPSMAHLKARFRQLKYDLAWLVDHLLHTCYTSPDNGDTESSSPSPHTLDLDSFLAAVTAILSEKSCVIWLSP